MSTVPVASSTGPSEMSIEPVVPSTCNGEMSIESGVRRPKVFEKGQYGGSFLAHLAVSKCADHMPIYRREKAFQARGIDPFEYLANVLARVQNHPARNIDALLPAGWIPAQYAR
jgi:hypothetical protein